MKKIYSAMIVAASLAWITVAQANRPATQRIVCPSELPSGAIRIGTAPDGWTPHLRPPFRLEFAAPTGGPPEMDAELSYYTTTHTPTARIYTYPLSGPNPHGIWMKCVYSQVADISLHKRLDDSIEQCKITVSHALPRKVDIECN